MYSKFFNTNNDPSLGTSDISIPSQEATKAYVDALAISDLQGVTIAASTNGQSLIYDSATGKWTNGDLDPASIPEIPASKISDITATAGEINYTTGVTSNIQDQLDDKIESSDKSVANGIATLDVNAKVPLSQISDGLLGSLIYQGPWDASTGNPPTTTPAKGNYWVVSAEGNLSGVHYYEGDWLICNADTPTVEWGKIDNTGKVVAVQGRTGNVIVIDDASNSTTYTWSSSKLTTQFNDKVTKNANITAGTACKITYDTKGLVTGGAALTASDIPALSGKYVDLTTDQTIGGRKTFKSTMYSDGPILQTSGAGSCCYTFKNSSGLMGYIGVNTSSSPVFIDKNDLGKNILTNQYQGVAVGSSTQPIYVNEYGVAVPITSYEGTAARATKLGTATVGTTTKPIYLNAGTATVCNEMVDLTSAQTVSGTKTFTGTPVFKNATWNKQLVVQNANSTGFAGIVCKNVSADYGAIGMMGTTTAVVLTPTGTYYNLIRNAAANTAVGSTSVPVYTNASGVVTACVTADLKAGKDASGNVITNTYAMKRGELTGAIDWNDYTEYGCYKIKAATMTDAYHAPSGAYDYGILSIERSFTDQLIQIYYPQMALNGDALWVRGKKDTVWTAWKKVQHSQISKGSATTPVYFDANGNAQPITSYSGNAATATKATTVNNTRDNSALKTWTGTKAQYDAIATKDANTFYNVTDDNTAQAYGAYSKAETDALLANMLKSIYPVGSIYIGTTATCPMATLISGSTWTLVAADRVLQGAGTRGAVGTTVNESLPNIKGNLSFAQGPIYNGDTANSALYGSDRNTNRQPQGASPGDKYERLNFDASRSSSIYQDNAHVQPDAYLVSIWERTA